MAKTKSTGELTLLETMIRDFSIITSIQETVLLQKNLIVSDDVGGIICKMNLPYIGSKKIPIRKLTEFLNVIKIKNKNSEVEFDNDYIKITDKHKLFIKSSSKNIIPYVKEIEDGTIEERVFNYISENKIVFNLSLTDIKTLKSSISKIPNSYIVFKIIDNEIKFIIIDKENPENILFEALSIPIETNNYSDSKIFFLSKSSISKIISDDYNCVISNIINDNNNNKINLKNDNIEYALTFASVVIEGFDYDRISNFIENYLYKNDNKKTKVDIDTDEKKVSTKKKSKIVEKIDESDFENDIILDDIDDGFDFSDLD